MAELKFHLRIPMDAWRQAVRHRTFSINEYSTRYSEAIDSQQTTEPDAWRLQSTANKQGSGEMLTEWPESIVLHRPDQSPGHYLSANEAEFHRTARHLYEQRLAFGVAREQARKDLPLSTYTEAFWKVDLHNLFHFLALRLDSHAQLEIRTYAEAIGRLIQPLVPLAGEAFVNYRLNGMSLSGPEIETIRRSVGRPNS
jgi:thymidylate synthase (FAD)